MPLIIVRNFCFCNNSFTLKKTTIAKIVVVLVLVSVTLWDTTNIINDYIYENRYTLVRVARVDLNDTFSFLKDTRLQLGAIYPRETIFRELWTSDIPVGGKLSPTNEEASRKFITEIGIDKEMSLKRRITVATLLEAVANFDYAIMDCTINENNQSCSLIDSFEYLDGVFKNTSYSYLQTLRNDLWSQVQPDVLRPLVFPNSSLANVSLFILTKSIAVLEIPTSIILTPKQPKFTYGVGVIGDEN